MWVLYSWTPLANHCIYTSCHFPNSLQWWRNGWTTFLTFTFYGEGWNTSLSSVLHNILIASFHPEKLISLWLAWNSSERSESSKSCQTNFLQLTNWASTVSIETRCLLSEPIGWRWKKIRRHGIPYLATSCCKDTTSPHSESAQRPSRYMTEISCHLYAWPQKRFGLSLWRNGEWLKPRPNNSLRRRVRCQIYSLESKILSKSCKYLAMSNAPAIMNLMLLLAANIEL